MILGVSVICGMVSMGVALITLCSAFLCYDNSTLCSSCVGEGANIAVMQSWSMRKSCLPVVVSFAVLCFL
jgi:hypothetical protein